MKNIILVLKREFLTQVKKKSFVILTLLTPLLIFGFGWFISLIFQANKSKNTISVIDKSGLFENQLSSDEDVVYIFVPENTENTLKQDLKENEEADGILIIPKTENYTQLENSIEFLTNKNIGYEVRGKITEDLSEVIKRNKIKDLGVDILQIQDLEQRVRLNVVNISGDKEEDVHVGVKVGMSMFLIYMIFMFIFMNGVKIMRNVLEEKNTRVVEILISSVKPFELMMGKILGGMAVALVQSTIWILILVFSINILGSPETGILATAGENVQNIFTALKELEYGMILLAFVVYFLLGYLFYSAIFAAVGSAVDNETETQQFMLLGTLPLMIGLYGSIAIVNNPYGTMSFWLSIIPLTSPIAMLARIPFGVPAWELALSMGILLVSMLGMVYVASKIYRIGILMYGNKATFKDLWKWIRNS